MFLEIVPYSKKNCIFPVHIYNPSLDKFYKLKSWLRLEFLFALEEALKKM